MTRLFVLVEGQTEETFVKRILASHLYGIGFTDVSPRFMGDARQSNATGIVAWPNARADILRYLKHDRERFVTTLVDYYGLPQNDDERGWPGRRAAGNAAFAKKAGIVQEAILKEIVAQMGGDDFYPIRFIPYVNMHEFEGLLFSDCAHFAEGIGRPDLGESFQKIRDDFGTPEEINDSVETAPSKRIVKLYAGYQKPTSGFLAAERIGLDRIRAECPNFRSWLEHLENLVR